MKRKKSNNAVGKKGRSGRKSIKFEFSFFDKLDKSLPSTIDFLNKVIDRAQKSKSTRGDIALGIKAAHILMSKAPDRTVHSGEINSKVRYINAPKPYDREPGGYTMAAKPGIVTGKQIGRAHV